MNPLTSPGSLKVDPVEMEMRVVAAWHPASFLKIRVPIVFATGVQARAAVPEPAVAESVGAAITGQVALFWFVGSDAAPQAMACRSNAAKIAAACGVPFARLPSSSSTTRSFEYHDVAPQPSELGRAQL